MNFELLQAQYFTLGTDPASVKWSQVRTENFRIIYPNTFDSQALYIAIFGQQAVAADNI